MAEQYDYPQTDSSLPYLYDNAESKITNIVGQIDPQTIVDNLDHALKGEKWNKEKAMWEKGGDELVNDYCRSAIINYLTPILTNNTTMSIIDDKRLSYMMEGIIESVTKMFICNLEKFGFVPPGERFDKNEFYNKGTPDSARMTLVSDMIYRTCFLVLSRSLKGQESTKIFKSLQMRDTMGYGMIPQEQKKGWVSKLFGR